MTSLQAIDDLLADNERAVHLSDVMLEYAVEREDLEMLE